MNSGIFLTVKDLMILCGSNSYNSCWRRHKAIRALYGSKKKKLTIKEYCDSEDLNLQEVLHALGRDIRG